MTNDKQIVFLDLETTGVDIVKDRIVQIAAMKTDGKFNPVEKIRKYLVNPGKPIPKEAAEIHGITDEMVKDKPFFRQIAKGFLEYVTGCDICGFNILDFDVPMLAEELNRAGLNWDYSQSRFYDSHRIFKYKEKRDLSGAVMFYTGKTHEGAHDAGEDITATASVFRAQLEKYEDLRGMDADQLAEFCSGGKSLDLAGKIILNDAGIPVYNFGKSKGIPVTDDRGFGNWMLKSDFPANTKKVVENILYPRVTTPY